MRALRSSWHHDTALARPAGDAGGEQDDGVATSRPGNLPWLRPDAKHSPHTGSASSGAPPDGLITSLFLVGEKARGRDVHPGHRARSVGLEHTPRPILL